MMSLAKFLIDEWKPFRHGKLFLNLILTPIWEYESVSELKIHSLDSISGLSFHLFILPWTILLRKNKTFHTKAKTSHFSKVNATWNGIIKNLLYDNVDKNGIPMRVHGECENLFDVKIKLDIL